ncbi:hypothetical protein HWV62_41312 [Athelia sp. TMB]|nr:hypothetical protein HWV62_41312 [Athelia sp. TMB]
MDSFDARDATHLLGHAHSADDLYNAAAAACDAAPAPRPLSYPAAPAPADTPLPARMTVQLLPSLPAARGQPRPPERPVDRAALLACAPDRADTIRALRSIEDLRDALRTGPRWHDPQAAHLQLGELGSPRPLRPTHLLLLADAAAPPNKQRACLACPANALILLAHCPNIAHPAAFAPSPTEEGKGEGGLVRVALRVPHARLFAHLVAFFHTRDQPALFRALLPAWAWALLHPHAFAPSPHTPTAAAASPRSPTSPASAKFPPHKRADAKAEDAQTAALAQALADADPGGTGAGALVPAAARLHALRDTLDAVGLHAAPLAGALDAATALLIRAINLRAQASGARVANVIYAFFLFILGSFCKLDVFAKLKQGYDIGFRAGRRRKPCSSFNAFPPVTTIFNARNANQLQAARLWRAKGDAAAAPYSRLTSQRTHAKLSSAVQSVYGVLSCPRFPKLSSRVGSTSVSPVSAAIASWPRIAPTFEEKEDGARDSEHAVPALGITFLMGQAMDTDSGEEGKEVGDDAGPGLTHQNPMAIDGHSPYPILPSQAIITPISPGLEPSTLRPHPAPRSPAVTRGPPRTSRPPNFLATYCPIAWEFGPRTKKDEHCIYALHALS